MSNYKNSKIYKIVNTENDKFYIGSTTQPLHKRICEHRKKHNKCMSKTLCVDLYKCSIILIEEIECDNKIQLLRKEREYFDKYKKEGLNIVNKIRPMRTQQEIKEYKKQYETDNKEKFRARKTMKYTCECGSICSIGNKSIHNKTKKHLKFITP